MDNCNAWFIWYFYPEKRPDIWYDGYFVPELKEIHLPLTGERWKYTHIHEFIHKSRYDCGYTPMTPTNKERLAEEIKVSLLSLRWMNYFPPYFLRLQRSCFNVLGFPFSETKLKVLILSVTDNYDEFLKWWKLDAHEFIRNFYLLEKTKI